MPALRLIVALLAWMAVGALRADEANLRVKVLDPFLELHTGPGRGYPVFHVIERNESIEVLKRRTDWFKIRAPSGKEGWVARAQMERTATEAGIETSFRDIVLEDYLARRFELGFAGGTLANDPLMAVRAGYKLTENVSAELTLGQASGDFSSSRLLYAGLRSEPFNERRVSPFLTLGYGRFENTPRATLVERVTTRSNLANAGLGVNVYLTERFLFRADFKRHVVFIDADRLDAHRELSLGFSFFF